MVTFQEYSPKSMSKVPVIIITAMERTTLRQNAIASEPIWENVYVMVPRRAMPRATGMNTMATARAVKSAPRPICAAVLSQLPDRTMAAKSAITRATPASWSGLTRRRYPRYSVHMLMASDNICPNTRHHMVVAVIISLVSTTSVPIRQSHMVMADR